MLLILNQTAYTLIPQKLYNPYITKNFKNSNYNKSVITLQNVNLYLSRIWHEEFL